MLLDILLSIAHNLIQKTAWPMEPPTPWSSFHIIFSLCGLFVAGILAIFLSNYYASKTEISLPGTQILWICGLILAVSEIYKQLFLYEIVNQNHYNWWYFPMSTVSCIFCQTSKSCCCLLRIFWIFRGNYGFSRTFWPYASLLDFDSPWVFMAYPFDFSWVFLYWT